MSDLKEALRIVEQYTPDTGAMHRLGQILRDAVAEAEKPDPDKIDPKLLWTGAIVETRDYNDLPWIKFGEFYSYETGGEYPYSTIGGSLWACCRLAPGIYQTRPDGVVVDDQGRPVEVTRR